jgi:hypothetical protein
MSNLGLGAAVLGVLLLAGIAGNADLEDAVLEQAAYCANVTLYHASAGTKGWPDYNSNYSEICKENQNI